MTATLLEARTGIAEVLRQLDELDNVYPYVHAAPTPPCAIVGFPPEWVPDQFIGGATAWRASVPVQVLLQLGANDAADRALCALLEPSGGSSVSAAFDSNADLNDVLNGYAVVTSVTDIGTVETPDGVRYLSATFNVEVFSA